MVNLLPSKVEGHIVNLKMTDPRHMGIGKSTASEKKPANSLDFGQLVLEALNQVNNDQLYSMEMGQQLITDPDSVEIHDVTIALAKANLSLSITKAIADGAIRAYREIISIR